ncbi:PFL_4695 family integrating conjugative element protein [Crenothrix polyspora]|jgi:integrating conjugative element protein (TIGR03765 family)|uniref:Integrating conjugative element protein, PFL_4695 family n=1 Tax=Crenothrix polyspora TaxID=360316 RepID=A0A1R4H459_9GAMM|nr:integrating conjugative element protein [Crenothrix polyspora]SJM91032.1 Integrating conjugative element protein, PFL_4695 family [Crenothrix polyspora]
MKSATGNIKTAWVMALAILHASQGMAEPVVIFDTGKTQSLAAYLPAIKPPTQTAFTAQTTAASLNAERLPILSHSLPMTTPELTPGNVALKTLSIPYLERPVFIIGADALSLQWIQRHRERLDTLHAVGWVVNVENAEQLAQLKQQAAPLELVALSGSELAQQFGLSHYPVLISSARMEQ